MRGSRPRLALSSHFASIFLINLDRRPDRWSFFQEQFSAAAGRDSLRLVERVPAVDGAAVDTDALLRAGLLSPLGHRRLQQPPERRIWGMDLTPGAVGCALSHVKLWARIAAAGAGAATVSATPPGAAAVGESEERFLVLEDDCVFPPGRCFEALYGARLRHVPTDGWGLLYLSGLDTARQCPRLMVADGVARVPQFHRTTNAYVVTPTGARQLLRACLPLTYQVDTMMTMNVGVGGAGALPDAVPFVQSPVCYTLMPPLITQSALVPGDIQDNETTKSPEDRRGEERERRRAAGWDAEEEEGRW